MLDFLHACLSATVAGRANRNRLSGSGSGRDALARLGIALALVAIVFAALDWQASGMEPGVELAQVQAKS